MLVRGNDERSVGAVVAAGSVGTVSVEDVVAAGSVNACDERSVDSCLEASGSATASMTFEHLSKQLEAMPWV